MKSINAKIKELESRLASEDYKTYKQEHPGTKKTPSDPMFKPEYGQVKPHLPHEEMANKGPSWHRQLADEHKKHSQAASKAMHVHRRSGNKEELQKAIDLSQKHYDAHNMHNMYDMSRTGRDPDMRSKALVRAKFYHDELSKE